VHDARVVDQHGDRAEGGFGGRHRRCPVRFARDVEAREDGAATEFIDQAPSLLIDDVRDHDIRALGDETARVASAHSTGAARDDHCPILEAFIGVHPQDR
jgi:hypothetical protein